MKKDDDEDDDNNKSKYTSASYIPQKCGKSQCKILVVL